MNDFFEIKDPEPQPDGEPALRRDPYAAFDEPVERLPYQPPRDKHRLPHGLRVTIDWFVTIVGAVAIVLAIKAWVVNPYRIPTPSMEPTLHCARSVAEPSCLGRFTDPVLANRFIYSFRDPHRGEI
ncbi:MAG: Signal peptidase peptidase, partial [Gaiellaceae bacterium]|nr:Signal peptidase peptidase [Gaiellaceae bacterium]